MNKIKWVCQPLKIYSNHLVKYFTQQGFYKGKIVDAVNRKIITKLSSAMDRFIVGSREYEEAYIENMQHKINQNGQLCISMIVTYPLNNDETIASYLMQKNFVVTQNLESNENSKLSRRYLGKSSLKKNKKKMTFVILGGERGSKMIKISSF